MQTPELIEVLKRHAACEMALDDWRTWWDEHASEVEQKLGRTAFLEIKPYWGGGALKAMLCSQKGALKYLQQTGAVPGLAEECRRKQDFEWEEFFAGRRGNAKEEKQRIQKDNPSLASRYPKFFKAALKAFASGNVLRPATVIPEANWPCGLKELFSVAREIKLEGVNLSVDDVHEVELGNQTWLVVGEYWKEADGDALLMKPGDEKVYYYAHEQSGAISELCKDIDKLMEKEFARYLRRR